MLHLCFWCTDFQIHEAFITTLSHRTTSSSLMASLSEDVNSGWLRHIPQWKKTVESKASAYDTTACSMRMETEATTGAVALLVQ